MGGSVNMSGALVVRVERVGVESVLGTIARLAERATAEKPRIVDLADRAAHWFVLAVLMLAVATGAWWVVNDPDRALWVTISVLIVTCPCALSLATPVALAAATGGLAQQGFVATRGHTVEALARASDFVFDKTGTLTVGALRVARFRILGSLGESACLAIASGLERASEHPYAAAIRAYARAAGLQDEQVPLPANRPGEGIEGRFEGKRFRIGSRNFCAEVTGSAMESEQESGVTAVYLAREREWLASFMLRDSLKPGATDLVSALQCAGKSVHLLSGDAPEAVADVARVLGIARVQAEAIPERKREYVSTLQASGRVVAMIGDGINDAPVLAQADVSVAMASGARLAQVKADAVLLSGNAGDLMRAIAQARKARRIIGQNIAWAIAYNMLAVPAAMLGWITPWMAGIGMAGSSLLVVLNAGRLVGRARVAPVRDSTAHGFESA
jgi:Cu2+-exporting ATPase